MADLSLYNALVVSNDDVDHTGKIQIRILPELADVPESDLPWAIPFISGNSSSTQQKEVLPVGSNLWVLIDGLWQQNDWRNDIRALKYFDCPEGRLVFRDKLYALYDVGNSYTLPHVVGPGGVFKKVTIIHSWVRTIFNIVSSRLWRMVCSAKPIATPGSIRHTAFIMSTAFLVLRISLANMSYQCASFDGTSILNLMELIRLLSAYPGTTWMRISSQA
jgi:hypothetical protein